MAEIRALYVASPGDETSVRAAIDALNLPDSVYATVEPWHEDPGYSVVIDVSATPETSVDDKTEVLRRQLAAVLAWRVATEQQVETGAVRQAS